MPVIRGLTGERIVVLQDGERAGDLSSTSSDHGLTVDPLGAQRIEVVRGPASLLYGNNALGGVVNVISSDIPTAVPGHRERYLATQGESVNPGGALFAGLTLPVGKHAVVTGRLSDSLTLRADNVGDTRYFDASSRIKSFTANPGRNLSLVYRLLY